MKNILELFNVVNTGKSVVCNRVDVWNIDGKDVEKLSKIWQLEKVSECEYCYKTFNGFNRGNKHFFFIDSSKTSKSISEYYDNFRKALCTIMTNVYGDEKLLLKIASGDLLNYESFPIRYTNIELSKFNKKFGYDINKYEFTTFKTRQTLGSNKSGEEAIREVLNAHIANIYPNGIRHDEYTTIEGKSRADSVVFNKDSIHVYEIKSAKDSFTRLESQIEDYRKYADRITIVMDIKKQSAFIKNHAHKYQGIEILFYYGSGAKLERASRGRKLNPTSDKFGLLWKNELYEQVVWFISKTSTLPRYRLEELASYIFTKKQAHDIVNEILYTRHKKSIGKERMSRGSVNMDAIFFKYKIDNNKIRIKANKYIESLET